MLAPLALLFLVGYHYTKRFTWLSHWVLGFTDGSINFIRFEIIASEESIGGGVKGATPTFSNAYPQPCEVGKERTR